MDDHEIPIPCSGCGRPQPRGEMFGVAPDLLCQSCRDGLSKRMHVRFRPASVYRRPLVTFAVVGLAAVIYLFDHWIFKRAPMGGPLGPEWWRSLWESGHAGEAIWAGHVHSLLTCAFFHGFFLHIFFNAWWVLALGRAVESGFGHWQMLVLVVGGAVAASAAEWIAQGSGEGLSGVVYALAFFLYVHRKTNPAAAMVMNQRTINYLLMWFVLCIVLTQMGSWNVANWAHGGGALWGWAAGHASLHAKRRLWVPLLGVATVLLVVMSVYVAFGTVRLVRGSQAGAESFTVPRAEWRKDWLSRQR
jgi:membrane associated rhomboid family serine protease